MITVGILGVVASLAVPQYQAALHNSRIAKAKQELKLISVAIDTFEISRGRLPLTLHEVGYGGRTDPWGTPYCFINYTAGSGDGLDWALDAGLVDPGAMPNSYSDTTWDAAPAAETTTGGSETAGGEASEAGGSGGSGSGGSGSGGSGSGSGGSGKGSGSGKGGGSSSSATVTAELAEIPSRETLAADNGNHYAYGHMKAAGETAVIAPAAPTTEALLDAGVTEEEADSLATTLASASVFLDVDVPTVRRRNQYMFPLNTDYDLFSLGPNAQTAAALNNPTAIDDVIRANNGGYYGPAGDY